MLKPNAPTLIKMEGVKKVFLTDEVETRALEEIHLEIKKGTYISIAGPSGCGKSTLLSILGLLDSPSDEIYELNDQPVANLSISERTRIRNREIGFIFQAFNLIGDLTVYENVELPLTYRGTSSSERKQKVQNALERVGMAHRLRHYPSQLSGGQQQRVAVARALVGDPLILMADEPTGNLDSKNGEAVMELLRDLHRNGATICMVTHDQRYANFAERTIHLFDGRIVEETQEAHVAANSLREVHAQGQGQAPASTGIASWLRKNADRACAAERNEQQGPAPGRISAGCKPALPVLVQLIWRVGPRGPHERVYMQAIWEDVRFGYRMLMKHRLVSLVCIVALALGIGANAAIFSMAEAFLVHPVPFENADRQVMIASRRPRNRRRLWAAGLHWHRAGDILRLEKPSTLVRPTHRLCLE